MTTIKLVIGSTRPVRVGGPLVDVVVPAIAEATGATVEVVDLRDLELPFLAEPQMAATGVYTLEATQNWSEIVKNADGIVWLNPEYNGGMPGAVKNAIDHLFAEWENKPTFIVGYGYGGGERSARHLAEILGNVKANVVTDAVKIVFGDNGPTETGLVAEPANLLNGNEVELQQAARALAKAIAA